MYWTLELASKLEDAPWPATKEELVDYAVRSGAPMEVIENLQEIEDEEEVYESIEDVWPDYHKGRLPFQRGRILKNEISDVARKLHRFFSCSKTGRPLFPIFQDVARLTIQGFADGFKSREAYGLGLAGLENRQVGLGYAYSLGEFLR